MAYWFLIFEDFKNIFKLIVSKQNGKFMKTVNNQKVQEYKQFVSECQQINPASNEPWANVGFSLADQGKLRPELRVKSSWSDVDPRYFTVDEKSEFAEIGPLSSSHSQCLIYLLLKIIAKVNQCLGISRLLFSDENIKITFLSTNQCNRLYFGD